MKEFILTLFLISISNILNAQDFIIYASAPWMTISTTYPQVGNNVSSPHLNNYNSFLNTYSSEWGTSPTHSADANAVFNISPWTARKFYGENFSSHLHNSNTLLLRGFEVKTEKWSGADICNVQAFWRVNGAGSLFSTFQLNNVQFYENCGSGSFPSTGPCNNINWQKWQSLPGSVQTNVVQNLTALLEGNYSLEVYYQANGNNAGGTNCPSTTLTVFDNNGGTNYVSTFAICPAIASHSSVNPTCPSFANGSITLEISGYNPSQAGTFDYRKGLSAWQSVGGSGATRTVTGLDEGNYEMRYTPIGAGCLVLTQSFTLNNDTSGVPSPPSISGVVTHPTCLVATGTFQINNFNPAFTYNFTQAVVSISSSGLVTANAGTYTFTVTNIEGCTSGASANIVVNPQPPTPAAPTISGVVTHPTCLVATGTFQINNFNPAFTYNFTPAVVSISSSGLVTANAGTYTFTVTNLDGCTSGASSQVVVNAIPNPPAVPIVEVSLPTCSVSGSARITNFNPLYDYIFDPQGPSVDSNGNIVGSIAFGTSYNLTESIGTLCFSESSDSFVIAPKLGPAGCTITFGISPNKDEKNDNWNIEFLNAKRVEIFNRWGMLVYSKDNYKNEWEGQTDKGDILPDGTYFWIIYFEDKESQAGWVYKNSQYN